MPFPAVRAMRVAIPQGWFLFYRDFQHRYSLTFFGYFWSVVRPLASALPLILIGQHFNFGAEGSAVPYVVFSFTGFLLWSVFWDAVTMPMQMMQRSRTIVKRMVVPESAVVFASVFAVLFNLLINAAVVSGAILLFATPVSHTVLLSLIFVPFLILAGFALGLPMVSLGAVYHDIRHGIGFLGSVLLWSAPILHAMPESGNLRTVNQINPLTYLIEAPREWLFQPHLTNPSSVLLACGFVILVFCLGLWIYKTTIRLCFDYVL